MPIHSSFLQQVMVKVHSADAVKIRPYLLT